MFPTNLVIFSDLVIGCYSYSGAALVILAILTLLVIWRRDYQPLKAHNVYIVITKILGISWTVWYLYLAWFNPFSPDFLPAQMAAMIVGLLGAWFYVGPTTQKNLVGVFHLLA
jgi:hypothetical protein